MARGMSEYNMFVKKHMRDPRIARMSPKMKMKAIAKMWRGGSPKRRTPCRSRSRSPKRRRSPSCPPCPKRRRRSPYRARSPQFYEEVAEEIMEGPIGPIGRRMTGKCAGRMPVSCASQPNCEWDVDTCRQKGGKVAYGPSLPMNWAE
jgi:hypothetical protein